MTRPRVALSFRGETRPPGSAPAPEPGRARGMTARPRCLTFWLPAEAIFLLRTIMGIRAHPGLN